VATLARMMARRAAQQAGCHSPVEDPGKNQKNHSIWIAKWK